MADTNESINKKMSAPSNVVQREVGNLGLRERSGNIVEEARRELQFPNCIQIYDEMEQNIVIASALAIVNVIASRTPYYLESYDQSDRHIKRKDFVKECLDDMTHTFDEFIREALTVNKYGFSIHEKVFYFRRNKNGSKFDDGKIGIKRIPIRSQASIKKWKFDKNVRDLLGVYQCTPEENSYYDTGLITLKNANDDGILLERDRFLHFKDNSVNGNPEGRSRLASCYTHWRKLQGLLEAEEIASVKNINGIPVVKIPAIYMSEDATPEQKNTYKVFKDGATKLGIGEQQSIIIPSDVDELGKPYFSFDIATSSSSNITAISNIVKTRSDQLLQALFADALIMAQGTSSAVSNKQDMLNMLVESLLQLIFDQINNDLIPDLFRKNGWDETKTPKIKYGKLANLDFSSYAKAVQQLKATKMIAVTPDNINFIAEVMQLPYRVPQDASKEELDKILGVEDSLQSKSGTGFGSDTGGLNGSGNSVSESDNSADNLSNA